MPTNSHKGGCLCGGVRYAVNGDLRPVVYCHCGQCKKTSGNYVGASACDPADLVLESDETLRWFDSSSLAARGFCERCGSNLFWRPGDGSHLSIFAGTFDAGTVLTASAHIFVETKASYVTIGDGLPQHKQRGPFEMTRYKK